MRRLLSKVLPDPDRVELIASGSIRITPALPSAFALTGCCWPAIRRIMPVWQGQGTTAACATPSTWRGSWRWWSTVKREALLDSYQQERRDHAKAMIDLSVTAGHVLAPPKPWQGEAVRDDISWLITLPPPPVKRYFLEMRFKPSRQYREGAADRRRRQDLAGGQNVYSTAGDAGERRGVLLDGLSGRISPLSAGAATRSGGSTPGRSPAGARLACALSRWCRRCRSTAEQG